MSSLKELYYDIRQDPSFIGSKERIAGTALAWCCAVWKFILMREAVWSWFRGKVHDGYALVLCSPFILAYWSVILALWIPCFVVLSLLVLLAFFIWMPFIEWPAELLNSKKKEGVK